MYYKVQFWSKTVNKQNTEALIWNEILFYTVTLIRDDFYLRKIGPLRLIFTVKPYLLFLYLYDKKKIAGTPVNLEKISHVNKSWSTVSVLASHNY